MFYFVTGYGFDRKNGEKWKGCATATLEKKNQLRRISSKILKKEIKKEILKTDHFPLNEQRCMRSREDFVKYNAPL